MSKPANTDPRPPGPMQRPAFRGVANGVVFAGFLTAMQAFGMFQPVQPLTDDLIARNVMAGAVFGFAVYVIELWRRQRRAKAADVARETVERRLEERDTGDDPR